MSRGRRAAFCRYCAGVIESAKKDLRLPVIESRTGRPRQRRTYLPSEQVVEELAAIPDLSRLAAELRDRLTETGD